MTEFKQVNMKVTLRDMMLMTYLNVTFASNHFHDGFSVFNLR